MGEKPWNWHLILSKLIPVEKQSIAGCPMNRKMLRQRSYMNPLDLRRQGIWMARK